MDLRRLRQFLTVVQLGSFGRAAVALSLSQPTLTRNIRTLEDELGAPLFQRGPRGATLTAAGQKFQPRAQSMVNEADRALAELDPGRPAETEQVRLGVSPHFLFDVAPAAIARCLMEAPGLNIQVSTGTFEHLVESIRSRDLDVTLCLVPDFTTLRGADTIELTLETLYGEQLVAVAPLGHPVLTGPVTLEAAAAVRWIVPFQMSLLYRFESAFHRHGYPVPMQALNTSSITLARRMVDEAGLLAMLPLSLVETDIAAGRLVRLDVPELAFDYVATLISRQRDPSQGPRRLADALREAARR